MGGLVRARGRRSVPCRGRGRGCGSGRHRHPRVDSVVRRLGRDLAAAWGSSRRRRRSGLATLRTVDANRPNGGPHVGHHDGVRPDREAAVTAAVVTSGVAAAVAGVAASVWVAASGGHGLVDVALSAAVALAFVLVGAIVAAARPHNHVGWVLFSGGTCWALGAGAVDLARHGLVDAPGSARSPSRCSHSAAPAYAGQAGGSTTVGVVMVFPDGHVAGPRWRRLPDGARSGGGRVDRSALCSPTTRTCSGSANGATRWRCPRCNRSRACFPWRPWPSEQPSRSVPSSACGNAGDAGGVGAPTACGFRCCGCTPPPRRAARPGDRRRLGVLGGCAAVAVHHRLRRPRTRRVRAAQRREPHSGVAHLVHDRGAALRPRDCRSWESLQRTGRGWLPWLAAAVVAVAFAPLRDVLQRAVNRLTYGRWDQPYDVLADARAAPRGSDRHRSPARATSWPSSKLSACSTSRSSPPTTRSLPAARRERRRDDGAAVGVRPAGRQPAVRHAGAHPAPRGTGASSMTSPATSVLSCTAAR